MAITQSVPNLQHGRVRVLSGDTVPLVKIVTFDDGNFSWNYTKPVNSIKQRGKNIDFTPGEDADLEWSFTAKWVDETLFRTLDQLVWDAQTETISGLTPQTPSVVPTTYDFEQGSLAPASGELGMPTLLAIATVPSADGEYSEALGVLDSEDVTTVAKATGLNIQTNAADTDVDITYDAVGAPTQVSGCPLSKKTFTLLLEKFDPLDPSTVLTSYILDHAVLTSYVPAEGAEADTITFGGKSFSKRVRIVKGAV